MFRESASGSRPRHGAGVAGNEISGEPAGRKQQVAEAKGKATARGKAPGKGKTAPKGKAASGGGKPAVAKASAVKASAVSGAGPAVLSELAVGEELSLRRLVRIPVVGAALARDLRAVWPTGHRPVGPARELLSLTRG